MCTTSLTFTISMFCPHTVFMCFVWISEQTAIISLYNINWLVCISETQCVYCAVRTGYVNQTGTVSSLRVELLRNLQLSLHMPILNTTYKDPPLSPLPKFKKLSWQKIRSASSFSFDFHFRLLWARLQFAVNFPCEHPLYRVFQKELYNFESL